ncbi:unnamed protein product [Brassica rapa subsp. trilocularis]
MQSPHRSKMVMKHVQGNLAQRIFARIWGFHPLPLPPMFSRVKQALTVSKIYGYCFTATFGGAGFLLGMWFVSFFIYLFFGFTRNRLLHCLVSSSGGVTTSPVSKGLRENEAVRDWVKVFFSFLSFLYNSSSHFFQLFVEDLQRLEKNGGEELEVDCLS